MAISHPTDPALFSISTDFEARLIRAKFAKLWDEETLSLYKKAVLGEMKRFQNANLPFNMIADSTEFPPQPQFLNELRQELIDMARAMGLRKSAIIVTNPIMKIQLLRLSSKTHGLFSTEKEALAWFQE